MYLQQDIQEAKLLITVKTYPLPSSKYGELVCTAGLLDGEKWMCIYPIPLSFLTNQRTFPKYSWIKLDLVRNTSDFRPESYRPRRNLDEVITLLERLGTANSWAARKHYVLQEVFSSINDLIHLAKSDDKKSLATLKPLEITGFKIEKTEWEWKQKWLAQAQQGHLFEMDDPDRRRDLVRKLPYKYYYEFLIEGDNRPRKMKIEDWEIGALFWRCLKRASYDEKQANSMVRNKYFVEFREKKDLHFFVGTTKRFHNVSPNPFLIIGVFYPPITSQALFI
ncbi:MAG: hypothetical protein A2Z14_08655 [Chloroflexi bacterium RBG_16_48_8]|nr:MAG: hypothetical protein A2Z14_08655 [Chloroflexi bacterium RBG_16_48_8]